MTITRRRAVKILVTGAGAALATGGAYLALRRGPPDAAGSLAAGDGTAPWKWEDIAPIERGLGDVAGDRWFGDEPDRVHPTVWAAAGAELPRPTEAVDLVIVGGGVSGLTTAYFLRDLKPVILEQARRFGGNAKGQEWRGIPYALGAAYVMAPEPGDEDDRFYEEIGIQSEWRRGGEATTRVLRGTGFVAGFWDGDGDPAHREQIDRLRNYFQDHAASQNGERFCDIPFHDESTRKIAAELDGKSFKDHLEAKNGGPLLPAIHQMLEYYCWTALGASASEVSAAAGMNFYAGEFGGVCAMPAGNAHLAERLLAKVREAVPERHLRPGQIVYRIRHQGDRFLVAYADDAGHRRCLAAKAVVMSCAKFIAARVVEGLEPERLEQIKKLDYRSYVVGNALIQGRPPEEGVYEAFLLDEGFDPAAPVREESQRQRTTDFIFANFARTGADDTVLTLYRVLPYAGARAELLPPEKYGAFKDELRAQLAGQILPALGIDPARVRDLRLARWGHPLPVPKVGFYRDAQYEWLRKPFRDRMFFVQQDNWALAAFETCLAEARHFAPLVRRSLAA